MSDQFESLVKEPEIKTGCRPCRFKDAFGNKDPDEVEIVPKGYSQAWMNDKRSEFNSETAFIRQENARLKVQLARAREGLMGASHCIRGLQVQDGMTFAHAANCGLERIHKTLTALDQDKGEGCG